MVNWNLRPNPPFLKGMNGLRSALCSDIPAFDMLAEAIPQLAWLQATGINTS